MKCIWKKKKTSIDLLINLVGQLIRDLTHCGLVAQYGNTDLGNIFGLSSDGTKPLPAPILGLLESTLGSAISQTRHRVCRQKYLC